MDPLADTADFRLSNELDKQVSQFFGSGATPTRVAFGALSHVGKVRSKNEDHYGVTRRHRSRDILFTNLPDGVLPPSREEAYAMVVADGMGGAAFGELASMLALRTAWDLTTNAYKWPFQVSDAENEEILSQLMVYGKVMHRALLARADTQIECTGMGSTITGILLVGVDAFIGHIGDSRAYLWRGGVLSQLTHDHTQAQAYVDAGMYASVAEAPRFMRHVLVNCLGGGNEEVFVETHHVPLADGDKLLLCTDGLSDMLSDAEIGLILSNHSASQEACQALVDSALDHGGKDNVTVVLASIVVE